MALGEPDPVVLGLALLVPVPLALALLVREAEALLVTLLEGVPVMEVDMLPI